MDSYTLSGDIPLFNGEDDMLAGEDLGFLPFLAAAVAPRLMAAAIPMAQRALARGGAAARLSRASSGGAVKRLSKGIRLPKPMVQRATNAIAEGQSPTDAFMSTFSSPENSEQEAELLGALNAENPLAKIISFVRSKLPLANQPLKTAVRDTAQNTVIRQATVPQKGSGLVKLTKPTQTNQALISKPVNPYTMPKQSNTTNQIIPSGGGGGGAGGTWEETVIPNNYPTNQIPANNPSANIQNMHTSNMFDDDLFLMMLLFGQSKRRRKRRYTRSYARPYRTYSGYRSMSYKPRSRRYYGNRYYPKRNYRRY